MELATLWACTDCTMAIVNDDYSGMEESRATEVRAAIKRVGDVSPGLDYSQHADDCDVTRDYMEGVASDYLECHCDQIDFSWSRCEICLSHLGGSRHAFTVWPNN